MAEARILITGEAIRISGMSDFKYTIKGSISSFTRSSIEYRYCVDVERGIMNGYYDYQEYLNYIGTYEKLKPSSLVPVVFDKLQAKQGDIITIYQRNISADFLSVCWYTYELPPHIEGKNYGNYKKISIQNATLISSPNCGHSLSASNFYNNFIQKAIIVNDLSFAETLADILTQIDYIEKNIFPDLIGNPIYTDYVSEQRTLWDGISTYNFGNKEEYQRYLSRLTNFTLYFESYSKKIGNDPILVFLYLAALMSPEAIIDLDVDIKLKMLLRLATGDLDNWQLFFYNPHDDESVVVKIINSITEQQADKFLDSMLESQTVSVSTEFFGTTKIAIGNLFNIFYKSINNTTLGLGKDNLTKFIMSMYQVWTVSNYNPYKNGVFSQNNLFKFTYNHEIGTNPDPKTNWWKDVLQLDENKLNFNASPIILNYNSSKIGGLYLDNFNFYFNSDSAFYGGNEMLFSTGFGSRFINLNEAPTGNKIFAVKKNYTEDGKDGLYGTYDYYQPVMLADSNQEAAIKIPVINGKNEVVIDGESQKINSLVPIFVLKYIDDIGDESDFFKVVGYTVDIISIAAGGYGLITKLRYLRGLSGFTEAIIAGNEYGNRLIFTLYLSTTVNAINITSATASFLIRLTGDQYKNEPWYKDLLNTVIWVEICSAGGSVLADKMLKISGKKLVNEFNSLDEWPSEFVVDPRGDLARTTLTKISGVSADVFPAAQRKVREILQQLKKKEGKYWNRKFAKFGTNGQPLHTEQAISEMVELAHRAGVPDFEIAELIHISYLVGKRIETPQLLLQIRYYSEVTRVKEYVAGFTSLENYKGYCNAIKNYWDDLFQYWDDLYGTSFKALKYDLSVHGSAIRKRFATDPLPNGTNPATYANLETPRDLEFAMLLDEVNFQKFINEQKKVADLLRRKDSGMRDYILNKMGNSNVERNIKSDVFRGMFKNNSNILTQLRQSARPYTIFQEKQLEKINFSLIQTDSRLALGPFVPFIY